MFFAINQVTHYYIPTDITSKSTSILLLLIVLMLDFVNLVTDLVGGNRRDGKRPFLLILSNGVEKHIG